MRIRSSRNFIYLHGPKKYEKFVVFQNFNSSFWSTHAELNQFYNSNTHFLVF